MKLDEQVCSLELAKMLKELGVKQESLFYWRIRETGYAGLADVRLIEGDTDNISAFTVAELGEMMPKEVSFLGADGDFHSALLECTWLTYPSTCEVRYQDYSWGSRHVVHADTEADARAKMLMYLLENKLISLKE